MDKTGSEKRLLLLLGSQKGSVEACSERPCSQSCGIKKINLAVNSFKLQMSRTER